MRERRTAVNGCSPLGLPAAFLMLDLLPPINHYMSSSLRFKIRQFEGVVLLLN